MHRLYDIRSLIILIVFVAMSGSASWQATALESVINGIRPEGLWKEMGKTPRKNMHSAGRVEPFRGYLVLQVLTRYTVTIG